MAARPANGEVNITFDLPRWTENSSGSLEVHDLRGARIAEFNLSQGKGERELSTAKWKPRVYIVILRVDGEVKDYARLVIQR